MSNARNLADLLDANGDVKSGALDNVSGLPEAIDVNASAPADSLNINSNGRVGIGISSPETILHIEQSNSSAGDLWTAVGSGNVPSLTIQNSDTTDNNNAGIFFRDNDGMRAAIGARFVNHSTNETQLRLSTTDSSGTTRERVTVSGSGLVTMPYQPAFAIDASSETVSAGNPFTPTMSNEEFDIGNNFNTSNSRFTAPVDGRYLFTGVIQFSSNGGSHLNFWVNGAEVNDGWVDFGTTTAAVQCRILDLNAGDYVQMKSYFGGSGSVNTSGNRTRFTGFLIG